MDRLAVDLSLRDERLGAIKADLTLDAAAPIRRASGTAHVERLNVRALTRDGNPRLASTITGDTRFDLVLPEEGPADPRFIGGRCRPGAHRRL